MQKQLPVTESHVHRVGSREQDKCRTKQHPKSCKPHGKEGARKPQLSRLGRRFKSKQSKNPCLCDSGSGSTARAVRMAQGPV